MIEQKVTSAKRHTVYSYSPPLTPKKLSLRSCTNNETFLIGFCVDRNYSIFLIRNKIKTNNSKEVGNEYETMT